MSAWISSKNHLSGSVSLHLSRCGGWSHSLFQAHGTARGLGGAARPFGNVPSTAVAIGIVWGFTTRTLGAWSALGSGRTGTEKKTVGSRGTILEGPRDGGNHLGFQAKGPFSRPPCNRVVLASPGVGLWGMAGRAFTFFAFATGLLRCHTEANPGDNGQRRPSARVRHGALRVKASSFWFPFVKKQNLRAKGYVASG